MAQNEAIALAGSRDLGPSRDLGSPRSGEGADLLVCEASLSTERSNWRSHFKLPIAFGFADVTCVVANPWWIASVAGPGPLP